MTVALPTQDYLNACLAYDPESGGIAWRIRPPTHFPTARIANCINSRNGGKAAGHRRSDGYLTIHVDGRLHYAHRLIWKMMTGQDPVAIDHVNLDRTDNRWSNLRACTHAENSRNKARTSANRSGAKGVRRAFGKFAAQITADRKTKHLGLFETFEEAVAAYEVAAAERHGEFARLGHE